MCAYVLPLTDFQVTAGSLPIGSYAFTQAAYWCGTGSADLAQPASAKWRPQTIRLAMVITRMSGRNAQQRFCNLLPVWFPAGETNEQVDQSSACKKPPAVPTQVNELLESGLTHNHFLFLPLHFKMDLLLCAVKCSLEKLDKHVSVCSDGCTSWSRIIEHSSATVKSNMKIFLDCLRSSWTS